MPKPSEVDKAVPINSVLGFAKTEPALDLRPNKPYKEVGEKNKYKRRERYVRSQSHLRLLAPYMHDYDPPPTHTLILAIARPISLPRSWRSQIF